MTYRTFVIILMFRQFSIMIHDHNISCGYSTKVGLGGVYNDIFFFVIQHKI